MGFRSGKMAERCIRRENHLVYLLVVKHEPYYDASACPGCGESDAIIKNYPATMLFFGHTHTYEYIAPNQLVIGNGGDSA